MCIETLLHDRYKSLLYIRPADAKHLVDSVEQAGYPKSNLAIRMHWVWITFGLIVKYWRCYSEGVPLCLIIGLLGTNRGWVSQSFQTSSDTENGERESCRFLSPPAHRRTRSCGHPITFTSIASGPWRSLRRWQISCFLLRGLSASFRDSISSPMASAALCEKNQHSLAAQGMVCWSFSSAHSFNCSWLLYFSFKLVGLLYLN